MVSTTTSPRSQHTSDPLLRPFLSPAFDPTTYLSSTLPSLSLSPQPKTPNALSLADLTAQTQTHIAQLSAQTSRLTTTLTSLTDDILRSGSRLAYEVEVLRGETISLSEALTDKLSDDIQKFVPEGLKVVPQDGADAASPTTPRPIPILPADTSKVLIVPASDPAAEPDPLASLRTLQHVRSSLQRVISTFDTALSLPLPPSLINTSSTASLISIASPATTASSASLEAAGQETLSRLRNEIADLLALGPEEGVLAAEKRVEELREMMGVWKGTAEEKARGRVVDGLAKVVADRRREVEAKGGLVGKGKGEVEKSAGESKKGFLGRLREEMYLE